MKTDNHNDEDDRPCKCGTCDWRGTESDLTIHLAEIPGLGERLDAGATVPAGECPECGYLAYLSEPENAPDLRDALRATARELAQWQNWQVATNPEYRDSEGRKHTQAIIDHANNVLNRCEGKQGE